MRNHAVEGVDRKGPFLCVTHGGPDLNHVIDCCERAGLRWESQQDRPDGPKPGEYVVWEM